LEPNRNTVRGFTAFSAFQDSDDRNIKSGFLAWSRGVPDDQPQPSAKFTALVDGMWAYLLGLLAASAPATCQMSDTEVPRVDAIARLSFGLGSS
jgi:hypothetical protein